MHVFLSRRFCQYLSTTGVLNCGVCISLKGGNLAAIRKYLGKYQEVHVHAVHAAHVYKNGLYHCLEQNVQDEQVHARCLLLPQPMPEYDK